MIKAFYFDYDGVITKGAANERIFGALATNLNVSIAKTTEWLMEIWRPYLKGEMTQKDVWDHLESRYGQKIDKAARDIWFTWEELKPLPEMLVLVESLKAHGYKVGVLSNAFQETAQTIQAHGGYKLFDFKVISYELKYAKPDTEIFHIALDKLGGAAPHEVVFLDDRERNAMAANELGMLGIYVTNHLDAIKKVKEIAGI